MLLVSRPCIAEFLWSLAEKGNGKTSNTLWVTLGNCISATLYIRIALLFVSVILVLLSPLHTALHSMAHRVAPREVLVERFGNLKLPLGGKYEYKGVRGKQGRARDRFQGCRGVQRVKVSATNSWKRGRSPRESASAAMLSCVEIQCGSKTQSYSTDSAKSRRNITLRRGAFDRPL